jgi:hypothetical protein
MGDIAKVILELLKIFNLNPSDLDKIQKEIEVYKEKKDATKKAFAEALKNGDIPALNLLYSELLDLL